MGTYLQFDVNAHILTRARVIEQVEHGCDQRFVDAAQLTVDHALQDGAEASTLGHHLRVLQSCTHKRLAHTSDCRQHTLLLRCLAALQGRTARPLPQQEPVHLSFEHRCTNVSGAPRIKDMYDNKGMQVSPVWPSCPESWSTPPTLYIRLWGPRAVTQSHIHFRTLRLLNSAMAINIFMPQAEELMF